MTSEIESSSTSSAKQLCSQCSRPFSTDDSFFRCTDCKDSGSNVCKLCVLDNFDDYGHALRACYLDPRDNRITWLDTPSPETFRELITFAQSDDDYVFPAVCRKFLQCGKEELPGISSIRFESFEESTAIEQEDARSRKIRNDYSLYEPLDHEKREIRIALLLQGAEEAPVQLAIVRMAYPWSQRRYIALSYTWGSLGETRPIHIGHAARRVSEEEKDGLVDQVFDCTANLELALRTLRREDEFTAVWIDALCINQADPDERAYQVGIMQEIYANSAAVCSWLDLSKQDVMALHAIGTIGTEACRARTEEGAEAWSDVRIIRQMLQNAKFSVDSSGEAVAVTDIVKLLSDFFGNPYFRRAWVLQEVWSARNEVFVIGIGSPAVSWQHVIFAHLFVSAAFRDLRLRVQGLIQPWQQFERSSETSAFQRMPILHVFEGVLREFEATDSRDKLFGLLAMGQETYDIRSLPPLIAPNYNKSISQVFMDFTKWSIIQSGTLNVLSYVAYTKRSEKDVTWKVPSWSLSPVSSFRGHGGKFTEVEDFHASADLPLDPSALAQIATAEYTITLSGYTLDIIARADEMYFTTRWYDSNDLYIMNHATNTYYTGGLRYIWARIGIGQVQAKDCQPLGGMREHADCDHSKGIHRTKWLTPEDMYADFSAHWVKNQTVDPDNGGDQDMNLFCSHNASRRKFAATKSGKLALVPVDAKEGDTVVALFGGKAPFLLRSEVIPDGVADPSCWQLIGECYIQSYMQGKDVKHYYETGIPPESYELR